MVQLLEAKAGKSKRYLVTLPKNIVKLLKWEKGEELVFFPYVDENKLVLQAIGNKKTTSD